MRYEKWFSFNFKPPFLKTQIEKKGKHTGNQIKQTIKIKVYSLTLIIEVPIVVQTKKGKKSSLKFPNQNEGKNNKQINCNYCNKFHHKYIYFQQKPNFSSL